MELSIYLAKVIGLGLVVLGVAMLINMKFINKLVADLVKSPGAFYMIRIHTLLIGSLLVFGHNVWEGGWPVIITVIGWLALLKGGLFVLFPEQLLKVIKGIKNLDKLIAPGSVVVVIVGGYLLYAAFYL